MLNVKLIAYTPVPERVIAAAAKICYSSSDAETIMEGLTPEDTGNRWVTWEKQAGAIIVNTEILKKHGLEAA